MDSERKKVRVVLIILKFLISLREIVAIGMLYLAYRFHQLSQLCGSILRFPMDEFIFECQVANMTAATVLFLFALGTWLYQSNYSYIRLHVRIFSIVIFWNVRHLVIEKCIKFGKAYETVPQDVVKKSELRLRKAYDTWELAIYEEQQIVDIARCEKVSLTLADVWLVLIKFLTLWVVFELAIEPCLIIGFHKLKANLKRRFPRKSSRLSV